MVASHDEAMFAGGKMPGILLSDGSMDQQFIDTGGSDVDGVYLTHPLTAKKYAISNYGIMERTPRSW
jgi:hypothetical protein